MLTVREIEEAILELDDAGRAQLRAWLDEQAADEWDRQIERDAASGKLDRFVERARAANRAGLTRDL